MNGQLAASRCMDLFGARVTLGEVPESVPAAVIDLPWLQASEREAVLRVDGVGRFHVRDGCAVVADLLDGIPTAVVEGWLNGTVAALVLVQRRQFALHASTVRLGGRLVAIAGPSGAGKSTTVCLLAQRGHPVVTDDVTMLEVDGDRPDSERAAVTVRPTRRRLHLLPSTITRLGLDPEAEPVGPDGVKRAYLIAPSTGTHRLGLIVALRAGPSVTRPVARRLEGAAAVQELLGDTYRPMLRRLQPRHHLRWVAAIAAAVPVVRVDRPADGWSGDQVAAEIENAVERLCGVRG